MKSVHVRNDAGLPGSHGMTPCHWVAHRGLPAHFPGNSLEGLRAVLESGACFVEFDIQISADGVPILFHDANMRRATGVDALVVDLTWERICGMRLRQGRLSFARVASLAEVVALLGDYPQTIAFVEIKMSTIRRGVERAMEIVLSTLAPIQRQCVPISFHAGIVRRIQVVGNWPVGWIFATWSQGNRRVAERLSPEYLFADHAGIPEAQRLFAGPWRWVLYEISDPVLAWHWIGQGAQLIETNDWWKMARWGNG